MSFGPFQSTPDLSNYTTEAHKIFTLHFTLQIFEKLSFDLPRAKLENYTLAQLIILTLNPFVSTQNRSRVVSYKKSRSLKHFVDFLEVPYIDSIFQPNLQLYRKLFPIQLLLIPKIMPRITRQYYSIFHKNQRSRVHPSVDLVAKNCVSVPYSLILSKIPFISFIKCHFNLKNFLGITKVIFSFYHIFITVW